MTAWWLELTDVDVCPESQYEHDAKRWGLQDGGPLSIARLPEPSVYGWTGKMCFTDGSFGNFNMIVDSVSPSSWIFSPKNNQDLLILPHAPKEIYADEFVESYVTGITVNGDLFVRWAWLESIYHLGPAKFGFVKDVQGHPNFLSNLNGKGIDGVFGLSTRKINANVTERDFANILGSHPDQDVLFSLEVSEQKLDKITGKPKGFLTVDDSPDNPDLWSSVDVRGEKNWTLALRGIKWTLNGKSFVHNCNEVLILDINTRFCYFNNAFLTNIHSSVSGESKNSSWIVPISSELPDQIEFIVERSPASTQDSTATTTSFYLPGSILRVSPTDCSQKFISAFRTIEHDTIPVSVLGNHALQYIKTYYKFQRKTGERFVAVEAIQTQDDNSSVASSDSDLGGDVFISHWSPEFLPGVFPEDV